MSADEECDMTTDLKTPNTDSMVVAAGCEQGAIFADAQVCNLSCMTTAGAQE